MLTLAGLSASSCWVRVSILISMWCSMSMVEILAWDHTVTLLATVQTLLIVTTFSPMQER